MRRRKIISIILTIVSAGLAILAHFILPEQVVIQFSIGSSGNTVVPKLLAILIPTALGIGGAVASMFTKDDGKAMGKSLIVSAVGIGLCIFMMVVNSLMK